MMRRMLPTILVVLYLQGVFGVQLPPVPQLCKDEGILPTSGWQLHMQDEVDDIAALNASIANLQGLVDSGCSDILGRFLCTAHLPRLNLIRKFNLEREEYLVPCAEVCRQLWRDCRISARKLGIERTKKLDCSKSYPGKRKKADCLSYLFPPKDLAQIVNTTRHSPSEASIVYTAPRVESVTQAFLIKFNETSPPVYRTHLHVVDPSAQIQRIPFPTINITGLESEGAYTFAITALNEFGEGPELRINIPGFDDEHDTTGRRRCEDITVSMCLSGLGYRQTAMPNFMGHDNQDDAGLEVHQFVPLVQVQCSPYLRAFLCSVYTPSCNGSSEPMLPCKELCELAKNGCGDIMNTFGFPWPESLACERLPNYSSDVQSCYLGGAPVDAPTSGRCEDITVTMCPSGTEYRQTAMPNFMGQDNQYDAGLELLQYSPLLELQCSPHLQTFLCALYIPSCNGSSGPTPPCKELCELAKKGCKEVFNAYGLPWPYTLACENFPSNRSDGPSCYLGGAHVDVPTSERCESITVPLCQSGIGYRQTAMPNFMGHDNQEDAGLEVYQFSSLVQVECSPYLRTFLCAMYTPSCNGSNQPVLPCKELCDLVIAGCGQLVIDYGFSWPESLACENLPSYGADGQSCYLGDAPVDAPTSSSGRCENITVPLCQSGIGYRQTVMPNFMGQDNQEDAGLEVYEYSSLVQVGCSPYLRTFLCAMYTPSCNGSNQPVLPCKELCDLVIAGCGKLVIDYGFSWPESLACDNLPSYGVDGQSCYLGDTYLSNEATDAPQPSNHTSEVIMPRRYDINNLGVPSLFRGWVDVQGQGAANDYCRVVTNSTGGHLLSCALAGMQGTSEFNYNSVGPWFDAGHMDTWYMMDVNQDGRDDYCRCVGCIPKTYVSCLLAQQDGFNGSTLELDPVEGGCHYNRVNPFFGRP